ncbi:hypothetical protein VIGAN_11123400, partial [Vigna angularis var. angularis]
PQHQPSLLCVKCKPSDDIDTSFFDSVNPLKPPEGFVAPPSFDDGPSRRRTRFPQPTWSSTASPLAGFPCSRMTSSKRTPW